MRLPAGWSFVIAALVWTVGGLLFERDGMPRQRGPATVAEPRGTGPAAVADQSRNPPSPDLPDISWLDPEIKIQSKSGRRSNSVGTGFPVSSDGVWLTARHVVDDCARVGIFSDPSKRKGFWVRDVTVHPKADIAVLRTKRKPPPISVRPLSNKLKVGQAGFHFGYPQGKPGDVVSHLIGRRKMRKVGGRSFVEPGIAWAVSRQAPRLDALGGMSGGPVLDRQGRVVGVTVAGNLRRGRVLTSPPATIHQTLRDANTRLDGRPSAGVSRDTLNPRGYPRHGDELRRQLSVAKVFCKARG